MTDSAFVQKLRDKIIADPEVILDDRDLMRALVSANEQAMGDNVVDIRGLAMARLERRLDRLEDTHRSVIAAAYENLAGANQIHRAVLKLLDPMDFRAFLGNLSTGVAEILRVDSVRLILESRQTGGDAALASLGDVLRIVAPEAVSGYMRGDRGGSARAVVLRPVSSHAADHAAEVYGAAAEGLRSEALMRLDLGPGRLPGMLALGSVDPYQFTPAQGTDLLGFFSGVFERAMCRFLA